MSETGIRRNAPAAASPGCVPARDAGPPAGKPLNRRGAGAGAGLRVLPVPLPAASAAAGRGRLVERVAS